MDGWLDGIDGWMDGLLNWLVNCWIEGWDVLDGRMGCMDGRMDGCMDGGFDV